MKETKISNYSCNAKKVYSTPEVNIFNVKVKNIIATSGEGSFGAEGFGPEN